MGMVGHDMPISDIAGAGGSVNWLLIGIIIGCFALGVVMGILLGRKAMKKRDI